MHCVITLHDTLVILMPLPILTSSFSVHLPPGVSETRTSYIMRFVTRNAHSYFKQIASFHKINDKISSFTLLKVSDALTGYNN